MKVRHSLNSASHPKMRQRFTMPSLTVPDQAMSIREILDRYARGLPLDGSRIPIYEGDTDDFPDPRTLDLAERQEFKEAYEAELSEFRQRSAETHQGPAGSRIKPATAPKPGSAARSDFMQSEPENPISEKNPPAAQAPPEATKD